MMQTSTPETDSKLRRWAQTWIGPRLAASALALALLTTGVVYGAKAAGGSDSYGYLSQADLWTHGWPRVDLEWSRPAPWPFRERTFAPIAYRPGSRPGESTLAVPIYAPGYPLLMAGAKRLAGQRAMFWIVPIGAAVLVLATFGIGSRLGSPQAGLVGAWLVATSPTVLMMTTAIMSDVPSAAAWAAASYFVLRGGGAGAAAAGLCAGLGILIRPNIAPLAAVLGAWYVVRLWQERQARGRAVREGAIYTAGVLLGGVAVALINQELYASPLESGYGVIRGWFALDRIGPNARNYLSWLVSTQTPVVLVGFVTIAVPLRYWWPDLRHRSVFVIITIFIATLWATYLGYIVFDAWWFLRFVLVGWPFMMVGVGAAFAAAFRSRPAVRVVAMLVLLAIGGNGVRIALNENILRTWRGEQRYPSVALQVRRLTQPNAIILSFLHSGSVRYYGGRVSLRYDWLPDYWLDEAIEWLATHGTHPYLLIDVEELPMVRLRFSGQRTMAILDRDPLFVYRGQQSAMLFDLLSDLRVPPQPSSVLQETFQSSADLEPAPEPRVVFTP
ncbi:MAG: glycosyltransferase family 39 protein [Acidobacteriota bacterium]